MKFYYLRLVPNLILIQNDVTYFQLFSQVLPDVKKIFWRIRSVDYKMMPTPLINAT